MRTTRLWGLAAVALIVSALLAIPTIARAATTSVPCDPVALQTAITAASPGDRLLLASGCVYTYTDANKASADTALPDIAKILAIVGNGAILQRDPAATTSFRILKIDPSGSLTLNDMTIRNGHAPTNSDGGGIRLNGANTALKTNNVTVTNNTADRDAGGIAGDLGAVTFTGGAITGNTAAENGGGIEVGGTATLNSSALTNNVANGTLNGFGEAGAIELFFGGNVTLNSTRVTGNQATATGTSGADGGAIAEGRGNSVTLNSSPVANNTAVGTGSGGEGGGIANFGGTLKVSSSQLTNNSASDPTIGGKGGGVYNQSGTATLKGDSVTGNQAIGPGADGGGILRPGGTVTIPGTSVSGNNPNNCGSPSTVPGCS
jgi:hypothetical protein